MTSQTRKRSRRLSMELLDARIVLTGSPYDIVTYDVLTQDVEITPYTAGPLEGLADQGGQLGQSVDAAPLSFPEGFTFHQPDEPESVFGNDDRSLINDPRDSPYRRHGSMRMLKSDGNWSFCSGAMVSPFVFLTAGHCVHDGGAGGSWYTNIQVTLARNGDERWYGAANSRTVTSVVGWTQNDDPDFDWALIELDRNIGNNTGWNGWWWYSNDNTYNGMNVSIAGYPSDLATQWGQSTLVNDTHQIEMYESTGNMLSPTSHQLRYNNTLDTFGGMSGSSVIEDKPNVGRVAVGIHAYGDGGNGTNEATRLREPMSNIISDITGRTPPVDQADLVDWDTWFDANTSFMSDTSVRPGDSFEVTTYPRNNGTANSGSYTVSFYASTNTFISQSDYLLGSVSMNSLSPFVWDTATLSTFIPDSIPEGTYNIGWIIDVNDNVDEFLESNNTGYIDNAQLTIEKALPDIWVGTAEGYAFTNNLDTGNAVADTLSFDAIMNFAGDIDSYYFAPEATGSYIISGANVGASVNASMAIYDAATGAKLGWGDDFIFSDDPIIFQDLNAWTRYIIAIADHEENSTGDVSISITTTTQSAGATLAVDAAGVASTAGTINANGDTDFYTVVAPVDATSVEVTLTPAAQLDGVVVLWDDNGNVLGRGDFSGTGGTETVTFNGVVPGVTYKATVFSSDYASADTFDLEIDFQRTLSGDFDGDEALGCGDVDALVAEIVAGTNNLAFDMNGDLLVDNADLGEWLATAGAANLSSGNPYLLGDANLDGSVDGRDFVLWNANKFTSGKGWCGGDFNADGTTDGLDFILWNANKFTSAITLNPVIPSVFGAAADDTASLLAQTNETRLSTTNQVPLATRTEPSSDQLAENQRDDDRLDELFAEHAWTEEFALV